MVFEKEIVRVRCGKRKGKWTKIRKAG